MAQHIKDSHSYYFSATVTKKRNSMPMAVSIALLVHVVLLFGISFSTGKNPTDTVKDVATALTQNIQENEEAHFIANASQQGGGSHDNIERQETSQISPLESETLQKTQDVINQHQQQRQTQYQQSYLRTTLSWRETKKNHDNDSDSNHEDLEEQTQKIRDKIATLEAQLSQRQQQLAAKTKIETVDSNATTYDKTSAYLEKFRQHVEGVANQHYPMQALAQGIIGDVRLMVIIKPDGNVKAIRLLESSGSTILDEAAKQSVRRSAPYGHFTQEMQDVLELRIIRTWRYSGDVQVAY